MSRKLASMAFAVLLAFPAFADGRQPPNGRVSVTLHLMNNSEFSLFLTSLNSAVLQWESRLKSVDVESLGLEPQDRDGLERSYRQCLRSLDNTHEEIQGLSQKQTLRLDLLLLVDLNDLARNLDGLDRDLANAAAENGKGTTQKSFGYVKEVLGIDSAVAVHTVEFQNHVFAFAKVIDATLEQAGETGEPSSRE